MKVYKAENEMISVAGERVWRGAVEVTTKGTIRMARRTDSSANTHDLKTLTIPNSV